MEWGLGLKISDHKKRVLLWAGGGYAVFALSLLGSDTLRRPLFTPLVLAFEWLFETFPDVHYMVFVRWFIGLSIVVLAVLGAYLVISLRKYLKPETSKSA